MISWQSWYDNLLPEDFSLEPIKGRCRTEPIEDFLDEVNEFFEYKVGRGDSLSPIQKP